MTFKNLLTSAILAGAIGTTAVVQAVGFSPADNNGDGVISAEEIKAAKETHRAEQIALYDTDNDGELSRDERRAMKDARRAEMLSLYDADGDGELSRDERRAAKDARRTTLEASLDVNGDGELSEAETAGFEALKAEKKANKSCKHGKKKRGTSV